MSKIKILPENLANQIAAGEVIERPASVVKELMENGIDAGAANIAVQVEGDGSRLIRIIDDGAGMDEDDVLLCLERHATSKLASAEQLMDIHTLGFRGEALASIASVSRMTITSRPREAHLGARAEVRFGATLKIHEMGCAPGTVMEVKDLFGNLPARRKFLKSKQTELSHIDEVVKNYALVLPDLGVHYQVQGRTVLDLPAAHDTLESRVKTIFNYSGTLVRLGPTAEGDPPAGLGVHGYLLPPESYGSGGSGLRAFVNGRMVKDRLISHGVNEGLQGFLLKGRRPKGALFITLPASDVDVNVHPTKQEIRFIRANQVHRAIMLAVRQGMEAYQQELRQAVFQVPEPVKEAEAVTPATESVPVAPPVQPGLDGFLVREPQPVFEQQTPPAPEPPKADRKPIAEAEVQSAQAPLSQSISEPAPEPESDPIPEPEIEPAPEPEIVPEPIPEPKFEPDPPPEPAPESPAVEAPEPEVIETEPLPPAEACEPEPPTEVIRYLGQIFDSYILCEVGDTLVAVDQHAAQERLLFEELCRQYRQREIPGQNLLFPEVVDLEAADMQIVEQQSVDIARFGLVIEEFGGQSFIIKAVPATLSHLGPMEILRGILDRYRQSDSLSRQATRPEDVLASMACKAAVKAGQTLDPREMEHLLNRMQQAGVFSHCPHGRPVFKQFSKDDVKRWFLRT